MTEALFRTACWQITTECNMRCPVCLRYRSENTSSLATKASIVRRLAWFGFQGVSISGGEPTLDPDLGAIIESAQSVGLWVALTTNGLLLTEELMSRLRATDELSLPLDGSTAVVHALIRGSQSHFATVTSLLQATADRPFQVVVNTVLTAQNMHDIEGLLGLLLELGVERWKLHRYYATGIGACNERRFRLTDAEFLETVEHLADCLTGQSARMRVLVRDTFDGVMASFVNVSPTGDILLFGKAGDYREVGNVLSASNLADLLTGAGFRYDIHVDRGFTGQYVGGLHAPSAAYGRQARSAGTDDRGAIAREFATSGFVELECGAHVPDASGVLSS